MKSVKNCAAPGCGVLLVRRQSENASHFQRRKTCGGKCRDSLISETHTKHVIETGRVCGGCGKPLECRQDELPSSFARRKTCGVECRPLLLTKHKLSEIRRCPICQKEMKRRAEETPYDFLQRKTCGGKCGNALKSRSHTKHASSEVRKCSACGEPLLQHREEKPGRFALRKTCGPACSAKLPGLRADQRRLAVPERVCSICHALLERRPREPRSAFAERQTCGGGCANRLRGTIKIGTFGSERACASCGQTLVPRSGELPANFKNRKSCDRSCGSRIPQMLFDFHGALLSRHVIGEILGVSKTTVTAYGTLSNRRGNPRKLLGDREDQVITSCGTSWAGDRGTHSPAPPGHPTASCSARSFRSCCEAVPAGSPPWRLLAAWRWSRVIDGTRVA